MYGFDVTSVARVAEEDAEMKEETLAKNRGAWQGSNQANRFL
jgi:hypothetical protein